MTPSPNPPLTKQTKPHMNPNTQMISNNLYTAHLLLRLQSQAIAPYDIVAGMDENCWSWNDVKVADLIYPLIASSLDEYLTKSPSQP